MKHIFFIVQLFIALSFQLHINAQSNTEEWKIEGADYSDYDSSFVSYWGYVRPYSVKFSEDSIIIDGNTNDAILLPTDLVLDETYTYRSTKNDTLFTLSVRRVNFTNVTFKMNAYAKSASVLELNGTAILRNTFYMGSEGVYEKSENESFPMNDFVCSINDSTYVAMLIPIGTNEIIGYSHDIKGSKTILRFIRNGD